MTESNIKKVALVGGGVIGGGWATRCLANGLEVVLTDPRPEAWDYVETMVADASPVLEDAGLVSENKGELHFAQDIAQAVQDADFVQENVPEREELKISVHEEISRHAREEWRGHRIKLIRAFAQPTAGAMCTSGALDDWPSFCSGLFVAPGRDCAK